MAKKSTGNGENVSGYFRQIFKEDPRLLRSRSNDKLMQRWLADHPDQKEVPIRVKQGLANVKSILRKRRRGPRRKGDDQNQAAAPTAARKPARGLERLEEQIDDCLSVAKILDRTELEQVIRLLRKARNEVVWKLGQ
jgi:hypothetical protein